MTSSGRVTRSDRPSRSRVAWPQRTPLSLPGDRDGLWIARADLHRASAVRLSAAAMAAALPPSSANRVPAATTSRVSLASVDLRVEPRLVRGPGASSNGPRRQWRARHRPVGQMLSDLCGVHARRGRRRSGGGFGRRPSTSRPRFGDRRQRLAPGTPRTRAGCDSAGYRGELHLERAARVDGALGPSAASASGCSASSSFGGQRRHTHTRWPGCRGLGALLGDGDRMTRADRWSGWPPGGGRLTAGHWPTAAFGENVEPLLSPAGGPPPGRVPTYR